MKKPSDLQYHGSAPLLPHHVCETCGRPAAYTALYFYKKPQNSGLMLERMMYLCHGHGGYMARKFSIQPTRRPSGLELLRKVREKAGEAARKNSREYLRAYREELRKSGLTGVLYGDQVSDATFAGKRNLETHRSRMDALTSEERAERNLAAKRARDAREIAKTLLRGK